MPSTKTPDVSARTVPEQIACRALRDPSGLLAAIISNPDEDTPRLIYADWLEENGEYMRARVIRDRINYQRQSQYRYKGILWDLMGESFNWFCGYIKGMIEYRNVAFDRGFLLRTYCTWQAWVKYGDFIRRREWVPLVRLCTCPGYIHHQPGYVPDVWIITREWTSREHGEAVTME